MLGKKFLLGFLFIAACNANASTETAAEEDSIWTALKHHKVAQFKSFIDQGQSVNATNRKGVSLLMEATAEGLLECVETLLQNEQNKADVNYATTLGTTALIYAAQTNQVPIAKILIENGADIDAKMKNGMNALLCATLNKADKMVAFLLGQGMEVDETDRDGATALWYVLSNNSDPMALKIAQTLIEKGANVDVLHKRYRQTPLMRATEKQTIPVIKFLLSHGADLSLKNHWGDNAKSIAIKSKNKKIIQLFEEHENAQFLLH